MRISYITTFLCISVLSAFALVVVQCDDKTVFGSERTIDIPGKSISIRLKKETQQSGNSTLNILVKGLIRTDQIASILVGDEPINVFSVDNQEFVPQDTVFLNSYADRTESTYEAQIRYNTAADSAQFLISLNGEIVYERNIFIQRGDLLKEQFHLAFAHVKAVQRLTLHQSM